MFRSARIKLTAWYIIIIILISVFFSLIIYQGVGFQFRQIENRFNRNLGIEQTDSFRRKDIDPVIFKEHMETARRDILMTLLGTNLFILLTTTIAGYFLAGRTLIPIHEALEEQKRFIADASHELRTPLTSIKTSLEVALRGKELLATEAKKILKSNLEDIENLQQLSDGLLGLAQYEKNENKIIFSEIDMAKTIENAYKKMQPLAKKKNIAISLDISKQSIEADKNSLEKLMTIFLDNAVKYTPKGGRVAVITKDEYKNVVIEVKDTGIGIDKKDLPYIFNRFYRVDQSRSKTEISGFGLGLSIAQKIVESHNGSIHVSSAIDEGTTFTVRLPKKSH